MSESSSTAMQLPAREAPPCSWLESERLVGGVVTRPDVTVPMTTYNLGAEDRLRWDDLPIETTYSLPLLVAGRSHFGRPILPFLIEDFLTRRSCRTAGELAEVIGISGLGSSLVIAAVGTQYNVDISFPEEYPRNAPVVFVSRVATEVVEEHPAAALRELTQLPVERLADVFGVSRVTYYNWMSGKPIALDNLARLKTIVALLKQVRSFLRLQAREFGRWLITPVGPSGDSPLDFLREGADTRVRALAMRIPMPQEQTGSGSLSKEVAQRSGVPMAPMRRIASRGWANDVKAETLADRLEQVSPSLQREVDFSEASSDQAEAEGWGVYHP